MSEVLRGYSSGGFWKTANLWARNQAFRADYIHRIIDTGVVKRGDKIAEFGSGQGHKSKTLLKAFPGIDYTGVELFPEMLAKAQRKLPYANFVQGDMTNPDDIPDGIDVAFYLQSLHHLDLEGRGSAAEAIHEKLPANGKLIIVDSFVPEVQSAMHEAAYRAYAVWSQYPGNKVEQTHHALRSIKHPDEYDPAEYGYHSPRKTDILGASQGELFTLSHEITPFFEQAISDILIFEKR